MKPVISKEYLELNKQLHAERDDYGSGSNNSAAAVLKICRLNGYKVVLDFGCGKGTLKPAMAELARDIRVLEFDPSIPGKDRLPTKQPDFIVALDVMEHIEPDYLDSVLANMRDLKPKSVMLMIATKPAQKTLPDGRNAHLIVEPGTWWAVKLEPYFRAITAREDAEHYLFVGTPIL